MESAIFHPKILPKAEIWVLNSPMINCSCRGGNSPVTEVFTGMPSNRKIKVYQTVTIPTMRD